MANFTSFAQIVQSAQSNKPRAAVVLGSGMGDMESQLSDSLAVRFANLPGLVPSTVAGHQGTLTLGTWAGQRVLIFQGRLHFYEGHPWDTVTQSVALAQTLGAGVLLLTNAAGGIAPFLQPGSLMAIRDHLEWTRPYCWRTPAPAGLGPPRPSPYSPRLLQLLRWAADDLRVPLCTGVYAQLTGPCYETPAEIRALRAWGADAVGMSTAREIQKGFDLEMECAAISLITNKAAGLGIGPLDHREVLAAAQASAGQLALLLEGVLKRLPLLDPAITALPRIPRGTT